MFRCFYFTISSKSYEHTRKCSLLILGNTPHGWKGNYTFFEGELREKCCEHGPVKGSGLCFPSGTRNLNPKLKTGDSVKVGVRGGRSAQGLGMSADHPHESGVGQLGISLSVIDKVATHKVRGG